MKCLCASGDDAVFAELIFRESDVGKTEVGEEGEGFLAVCFVYLEDDGATVTEGVGGIVGDGAIEEERVGIGNEEGDVWLMVEDIRVHGLCLLITYIRRIADDEVP